MHSKESLNVVRNKSCKSRHYSFPIDVWGGRQSYIELDICLLNQKRSVKPPLSSRDNGEFWLSCTCCTTPLARSTGW
jgi:hypothetical protein